MFRMRVTWSGTQVVGPGVTTLYADSPSVAGWPAAVVTLFNALKNYVPTGITWTIPGTVDTLEVEDGDLIGSSSPGGGGTVASAGGAVDYKPGVGARLRWGTSGIVGGRRVTGTTFLVPLTSQEYPNGVVQSSTRTAIETAMAAYIANAGFVPVIYSKEVLEDLTKTPPVLHRDGRVSEIVSGSVSVGETWLRSRRT
jgi:hypothetical protein